MRMSRPQKSQMRGFRATQRGGVADAFAQNQIQEFQTHVIQGAGARIAVHGRKKARQGQPRPRRPCVARVSHHEVFFFLGHPCPPLQCSSARGKSQRYKNM